MLKRRTRTLAATGITIAAIVSASLGATGALTASPASAATAHVTGASAAAAGCVRIQLGNTTSQLWDDGPFNGVYLSPAPASCWHRSVRGYPVKWYGVWYTAYEYQDIRGDCLWDSGGFLDTTTGPCTRGVRGEEFFGIRYYHNGYDAPGWALTDDYWGPDYYFAAAPLPPKVPPKGYTYVFIYKNGNPGTPSKGGAPYWNFP